MARYFVVRHFGGVYADMDFEALRPLDELLAGRSLVFGLEPDSHMARPTVRDRGFSRIVCNALFASEARHPFWDHLFAMLPGARGEENILDATGPFLLTRACDSYEKPETISLVPARLLYPIDNYGQEAPSSEADERPYAVHHWHGTWWREAVVLNARNRILARRSASPTGAAE